MAKRSFVIDQSLYKVLNTFQGANFTTEALRDIYASQLLEDGIEGVLLKDVRLYVYEYIRKMLKSGLVTLYGERKRRGQVYHLGDLPSDMEIELVVGKFHRRLPACKADLAVNLHQNPIASHVGALRGQLKELELDMHASMGEVERYNLLMTEIPELRTKLKEPLESARERSSKLIGHFRAVENTLLILRAT
ncbi:hypothetical protein AB4876_05410 [Zhongshania guokunii]|uniref:Transcriptional regulator VspR n=1 Tax=Zhongshania guokunii TaxID=641783 RepID=A0ABV3U351_9GAMM